MNLRHRPLALALGFSLGLGAAPAWGQVDPNLQRGFGHGTATSGNGIDQINLFNGNLALAIPIGPEFRVNADLSYRLTLVYNSSVWDVSEEVSGSPPTIVIRAEPGKHANAGLGWTLSLGQLFAANSLDNPTDRWLYVDESGGSRSFYSSLHNADPDGFTPNVFYTRDGSYLRLRKVDTGGLIFEVDFPNGTVRRFVRDANLYSSPFRLQSIRDPFGNTVTVTMAQDQWTIEDPHRSHFVNFKTVAGMKVVDSVQLEAVGPGRATYDFRYGYDPQDPDAPTTIEENCRDTDPKTGPEGEGHGPIDVALLSAVVLPASAGSYEMPEYYATCEYLEPGQQEPVLLEDLPGVLRRLRLPTFGQMEWTYQKHVFPSRPAGPGSLVRDETLGVKTKRALDPSGACPTTPDGVGCQWSYRSEAAGGERRTTVTAPTGDETIHYFSQPPAPVPSGWTGWQYGLPFSLNRPDGSGNFLSAEVFDGTAKKRSVYVAYEHDVLQGGTEPEPQDWYNSNRRKVRERIVFEDDPGKTATTVSSEFDGMGNFRRATLEGSFGAGDQRTDFTLFNPTRGTYVVANGTNGWGPGHTFSNWPAASPWILGTFTERIQTEGSATEKQAFCFDGVTGFLHRIRRYSSGTSPSGNDVVTAFTPDPASTPTGNVVAESFYGGDGAGLAATALCDLGLPAPGYVLRHEYDFGSLRQSKFDGVAFKSYDVTIDPDTGLVSKSRDPAGVETTFTYDAAGRRTWATPPATGEARTNFKYTPASLDAQGSFTPARVDMYRKSHVPPTEVVTFTSDRIVFDAFGRVNRNRRWLGTGDSSLVEEPDPLVESLVADPAPWATQEVVFNALGRVARSSTVFGPGAAKKWFTPDEVDVFGRPGKVKSPDGSETTFTYTGVREFGRTVKIATGYAPGPETFTQTPATTTERYDRQGRLFQIVEPSGPGGAEVTTTYSYDAGSRLSGVSTTSGGITQTRVFTFDGRGFLLSEQHPEKGSGGNGTVVYSNYDAAGNAGRRREGIADGPYDLLMTFDAAQRLRKVEERRILPGASGRRTLKEFTYDTPSSPADLAAGKLKTAVRHNWVFNPLSPMGADADVTVTETYRYEGRDGSVSRRDTALSTGPSFTQSWVWNEIGDPASIAYPSCTFSQCIADAPAQARTVSPNYAEGLLSAIPGFASSLTYHPNGTVSEIAHANGVTWGQGLDANYLPRPAFIGQQGAHVVSEGLDYQYDGAGNVMGIEREVYLYDKAGRVTFGGFDEGVNDRQETSYDAFGNLTSITTTRGGVSTPVSFSVLSGTNRISGLGYDDAGSLLGWGTFSYQHDAFGQLERLTGSGLAELSFYTADDERVWTADYSAHPGNWQERFFLRDLDGRVLRVFGTDTGTNGDWLWDEDYVWRDGGLLASVSPVHGTRHYLLDHLGTPRMVTDATGQSLGLLSYFPYGEQFVPSPNLDATRMRFTGHERDRHQLAGATDDLDYMHARYYSAMTGRFLSTDPVGGNPRAPQSWNRYAYVMGNPLNYVDPFGLNSVSQQGIGRIEQQVRVWDWTIVCASDPCSSFDLAGFYRFFYGGRPGPSLGGRGDFTLQVLRQVGNDTRGIASAVEFAVELTTGTDPLAVAMNFIPPVRGLRVLRLSDKIVRQVGRRGWTRVAIDEAVETGQQVRAINKANGNPATRYIHPGSGQSVVVDDVTGEVIHVGGPGFSYGPQSGDLP